MISIGKLLKVLGGFEGLGEILVDAVVVSYRQCPNGDALLFANVRFVMFVFAFVNQKGELCEHPFRTVIFNVDW